MAKRKSSTPARMTAHPHDKEHAQLQRLSKRLHAFRAKFREVHVRGTAALKTRDYETLGDAIRSESQLIERHRRLIDEQRALVKRRLAQSRAPRPRRR